MACPCLFRFVLVSFGSSFSLSRLRVFLLPSLQRGKKRETVAVGWCSMDLWTWTSTDGNGFLKENKSIITVGPLAVLWHVLVVRGVVSFCYSFLLAVEQPSTVRSGLSSSARRGHQTPQQSTIKHQSVGCPNLACRHLERQMPPFRAQK